MLILLFLMVALIIFCDIRYRGLIYEAVTRANNPIVITEALSYIEKAYDMLNMHIIFLVISSVLTALGPVFKMLLSKINTAVDIDGYDQMEAIDISSED